MHGHMNVKLVNFSSFLLTVYEQDLVSVTYLNKFIDLWCPVTENSSTRVVHQIRCFRLPEDGSRAGFRNLVLHYRCDDGRSPKKEHYFTKSYMLCSSFSRAFAKLRKAIISFDMSVCPSIRLSNGWASTERIFMKFVIWVFFFFSKIFRCVTGAEDCSGCWINTFTAIVDLSRFNNSCLKLPASTLVDLTFQSRALRSFSLNQLRNLSL